MVLSLRKLAWLDLTATASMLFWRLSAVASAALPGVIGTAVSMIANDRGVYPRESD